MKKYCEYGALAFASGVLIIVEMLIPSSAYSATNIYEKTFSKNETWSYAGNPYYVYGRNIIPKGVTLTIGKGAQIEMQSAQFVVESGGKIMINGSESSPVIISQDSESSGFFVKGPEAYLEVQHANIVGGKKILYLYDNSEALLSNLNATGLESYDFAISAWKDASLTIASSNFNNISSPGSVEAFGGSKISISESVFNEAGSVSAISIYGKGILNTIANLESLTISGAKNGIEIFNGAIAKISTTSIKNSSQTGLLMHNNADVEILSSEFSGNNTGIESYDASSTISESAIEGNKTYGAYVSGGSMIASKNWWGDKSGPFYEGGNIRGSGDVIEGSTNPSPWLDAKPLNEKCCSSV